MSLQSLGALARLPPEIRLQVYAECIPSHVELHLSICAQTPHVRYKLAATDETSTADVARPTDSTAQQSSPSNPTLHTAFPLLSTSARMRGEFRSLLVPGIEFKLIVNTFDISSLHILTTLPSTTHHTILDTTQIRRLEVELGNPHHPSHTLSATTTLAPRIEMLRAAIAGMRGLEWCEVNVVMAEYGVYAPGRLVEDLDALREGVRELWRAVAGEQQEGWKSGGLGKVRGGVRLKLRFRSTQTLWRCGYAGTVILLRLDGAEEREKEEEPWLGYRCDGCGCEHKWVGKPQERNEPVCRWVEQVWLDEMAREWTV